MTTVAVLYACVRIIAAVPCPTTMLTNYYCHNEPLTEHEFRTRLEEPLTDLLKAIKDSSEVRGPDPVLIRASFTDGDWRCEPLHEFAVSAVGAEGEK